MRLEDLGKEVKKTGYLRGTRMWGIRNRIIAGVISGVLLFDFCWIVIAQNKKGAIEDLQKKRVEAVQENQLEMSRRVKALEERRIALQDELKKV